MRLTNSLAHPPAARGPEEDRAPDHLLQHQERTGDLSEAISDQLATAEVDLKAAREAHRKATASAQAERLILPPAADIEATLQELAAVLTTVRVKARALLSSYLDDGRRKLLLDTRGAEVRLSGVLDLSGASKLVAGARYPHLPHPSWLLPVDVRVPLAAPRSQGPSA
jgi:hypothetical protein